MAEKQHRAVGRGQFSLWSLLVVLSVACIVAAGVGYWRSRPKPRPMFDGGGIRQALPGPSLDVGLPADVPVRLDVVDPERLYVRGVEGCGELAWRFRVFVPPGKHWLLGISQGEAWDKQANEFRGCVIKGGLFRSGELVFDVGIVRDSEGHELIMVSGGCSATFEEPALAVLRSNGEESIRALGHRMQEVYPAAGRIVLLQYHRKKGDVADAAAAQPLRGYRSPLTGYGVSVFLEEQTSNR